MRGATRTGRPGKALCRRGFTKSASNKEGLCDGIGIITVFQANREKSCNFLMLFALYSLVESE